MAVFSANTVTSENLTVRELGSGSAGPEKFSKVDDSKLSGGLLKYDKYTTTFTFAANTAVYIKATFIGNLDRSSATPAESNYEAVTYEILNDSVEIEHLYNLDSEELIMKATRTATSTVTTIDIQLQNLNDQTFFFTAYYEGYTFDGGVKSISGVSSNFLFGARGVVGGGNTNDSPSERNSIRYIPIQTAGDTSVDFGNMSVSRENCAGVADDTRAVAGGGYTTASSGVIDYVTVDTLSDAYDFGDMLEVGQVGPGGTGDGSRGVFMSKSPTTNRIEYITIATTGNANDFGDLSVARYGMAACSDGSRALGIGGFSTVKVDTIDYITISTIGNATDFGNLDKARQSHAASSGA